ncbi:hypothetical protein G9464_20735 [Halostella sp. JP-L12]|nr:hypothetical protein [Halostella sp. JP-L12]
MLEVVAFGVLAMLNGPAALGVLLVLAIGIGAIFALLGVLVFVRSLSRA